MQYVDDGPMDLDLFQHGVHEDHGRLWSVGQLEGISTAVCSFSDLETNPLPCPSPLTWVLRA